MPSLGFANSWNSIHRPRKTTTTTTTAQGKQTAKNSKEQQQQQPPKENNQPTFASPKTSITRILRQYALVEGWKTKQCTHLIPFTAFTASRRFRKGKFLFPLSMKKMLNSPNSLSSAFTTSALTVRLCKMQTLTLKDGFASIEFELQIDHALICLNHLYSFNQTCFFQTTFVVNWSVKTILEHATHPYLDFHTR